ncbi:MAG: cytochrome c [Gammaproteobacteria bacterium]|nr:cytochrome c [Gammaproteobacteria bacterium]
MKWFTRTLLITLALSVPATAVQADGHLGKAVKARKAYMQLLAFNLGQLGAMAKGKAPYDAGQATLFATNLQLATQMNNSAMWPEGTDNAAMPGKTRALPVAWEAWPEIGNKNKELAIAAGTLAATAAEGLEILQAGVRGVGKTCRSCHKKFRAPKKKK